MMTRTVFLVWLAAALPVAEAAPAQEQAERQVWVQIEARPTETEAGDRARSYAESFPDVSGFRLSSGWYGIVLGPYAPDVARLRLNDLRAAGMIPRDSFIADGRNFREPFLVEGEAPPPAPTAAALPPVAEPPVAETPVAETPVAAPPDPETPVPEIAAAPGPAPESAAPVPSLQTLLVPAPADTGRAPDLVLQLAPPVAVPPAPETAPTETPAEARRAEAQLLPEERQQVQAALHWFGFYAAAIDGAFGAGTRASMAAWQQAEGAEPTGILTSRQRRDLIERFQTAQAALGLQTLTETQAGIEIALPSALVRFDHYDPPFVHYVEKDGSGVQVTLISEPGDQGTLAGLYDILQTLDVVPPEGTRERRDTAFTIEGRSDRIASYTRAELKGGLIKGFMLVWHPADDERMARVLTAMQSSFRPVGTRAMDPGLVPLSDDQRRGMLAGLDLRRPKLSRSGMFLDGTGRVLTTLGAVETCRRITIDRDTEARVAVKDASLGIAVLVPESPLAPRAAVTFREGALRRGAPVAVAGYPYQDVLPAPTLTFGALDELTGLEGEPHLLRLTLAAREGDTGGPVLDAAGSVLGMLVPDPAGPRQFPPEVAFAVSAEALAARLAEAGIQPKRAGDGGALAPEDLTRIGDSVTALVSCWD